MLMTWLVVIPTSRQPETIVAQACALPPHAHMMPQVTQRSKVAVVQEPKWS